MVEWLTCLRAKKKPIEHMLMGKMVDDMGHREAKESILSVS